MTEAVEEPKPGKRGVLVIVVMAAVFFTLLALLLAGGRDKGIPATRVEELYVLPTRLRLRTQPSAKAPVVATALRAERLRLLEDRGAWVRVQNREGIAGWADRSGLEAAAEHDRRLARYEAIRRLPTLEGMVEQRVPLYAGPGIFYSIVGELAPDSRVKIYTRDHDFYAVEAGDDIAYAEVDAISLSASGSPQVDVAARTRGPLFEEQRPRETAELPPPEFPLPEVRQPIPLPEPRRPPVESRVYPAVPPGGTQPMVIDRVMPRYPMEARHAGVEGPVVIRAIIRRDGTVDEVEVLRDLSHGLGEAAARAVRRWRFEPATYRGEPIDVYYTVTVNFRLD